MELRFDANEVLQERLASSMGLNKYQFLTEQLNKTDISTDENFQRVFNGFYIVRRNQTWRKVYYEYFEYIKNKKPTFASILTYLYEKTGNIEPSFASKMLATIIPEKPIWDHYVIQNLNLKLVGATKREKLENAMAIYSDIEKWYEDFLQTDEAKECIEVFDHMLPKYKNISSIKKIDSIIWSIR